MISLTSLAHNRLRSFIRFLVGVLWLLAEGADARQVVEGDRGYGLTVVEGTRIDTFQAEVLGWEHNGSLPGRSRIIVRLSGLGLEQTGFVQGMSGSPVYVDDELIGAVSWGWSFAEEPVGLLTPIDEMLEILDHDLSAPPATAPDGWQRLASPVWMSGAGPATRAFVDEVLAPLGLKAMTAGAGGLPDQPASSLRPGSAAGVQFVGGDLNLTGIGTVTYVDDDRLVAFGHNLMGQGSGAIDMPLTGAYIHGILDNASISFKLGSATDVVGAVRQDRFSGIGAVIGAPAHTLPMEVTVHASQGDRPFHFDIARHRFFTTGLAQICLLGAIESAAKAVGDASLRLSYRAELADGRSAQWQRVYTGSSPQIRAALEAGPPIRSLTQARFADLRLSRLSVEVHAEEAIHAARIESARLARSTVQPGQSVDLIVRLSPFGGSPFEQTVSLSIPQHVTGQVRVRIGSGRRAAEWESERWERGPATSSDDLLRRLRQPARDDELVVELIDHVPGLAVGDRELPAPPPSVRRLLAERHTAGRSQTLPVRILDRQRLAVDFALTGEQTLTVLVEKGRR